MATVTRIIGRFLLPSFQKQKVRLHASALPFEKSLATGKPMWQNSLLELEIVGSSRIVGCRCIQSSARTCKMWEVPSQKEVEDLRQVFHNPKSLLCDLFQPLVDCGMTAMPQVVLAPRLGGQFWKAKLHLQWPSKATISAVHSSETGAEENVYLLACQLFKDMGLLYEHSAGSVEPVGPAYVIDMLQTLHSAVDPFTPLPPPFYFVTMPMGVAQQATAASSALQAQESSQTETETEPQLCKSKRWCTNISSTWPYSFHVSSQAPSLEVSQYCAALFTCIKLKTSGLLDSNNRLAESRLPYISYRLRNKPLKESHSDFHPDFELYSDASAFGFGAYLLNKDDNCVHWLADTWSEHFPGSPPLCSRTKAWPVGRDPKNLVRMDSTFCELYSLVAACYTWKHKFVDKRLLVRTDSQAAVDLVNRGVWGRSQQERWGKLYRILASTCHRHRIDLHAHHVHRSRNVAADFLSRRNLAAFKRVVPEAALSEKKTKKLWFWNPLQPAFCQPAAVPGGGVLV